MITLLPYQQQALDGVLDAMRKGSRRPLLVLPCGAGKTVLFAYMAEHSQAKGKRVWFLVHRQELLAQTIQTFQRFSIPLRTIEIGMVGTFARHLEEHPVPDLIIFDEAHFSAAKTWRRIMDRYPQAFFVGLTATPCRLDGKPLGEIYDSLVEGISPRELMAQGYLAPYRYFAPTVADVLNLGRKGGEYDLAQAAELLSQRKIYGDVIAHWKEHAQGVSTICYCASVAHSKSMAQAFREAGVQAVHFDGDTPKKEREEIIRRFRSGEITLLCNVDLISVGFDVPGCGCCILLRPTLSTALFIQQACRALRPQQGKTAVILDHVGNYQRHGLPDEERAWNLQGQLPTRKEYTPQGRLRVRQCPACFSAYDGSLSACPYCGAQAQTTRGEMALAQEIHLQEIKERKQAAAQKAVEGMEQGEQCRTPAQLYAFAKKKGYKPGWAYYQCKQRGWLP